MNSADRMNPTLGSLSKNLRPAKPQHGKKFCYLGVLLPLRSSQNHTHRLPIGWEWPQTQRQNRLAENATTPDLNLNLNLFKTKPPTWEGLIFLNKCCCNTFLGWLEVKVYQKNPTAAQFTVVFTELVILPDSSGPHDQRCQWMETFLLHVRHHKCVFYLIYKSQRDTFGGCSVWCCVWGSIHLYYIDIPVRDTNFICLASALKFGFGYGMQMM